MSVDGASTWISLSGPLPTKLGSDEICHLIEALAGLTGQAVRVVLSAVDGDDWSEWWLRELSRVPEDLRKINTRVRRRRTGGRDDEQLELFGAPR